MRFFISFSRLKNKPRTVNGICKYNYIGDWANLSCFAQHKLISNFMMLPPNNNNSNFHFFARLVIIKERDNFMTRVDCSRVRVGSDKNYDDRETQLIKNSLLLLFHLSSQENLFFGHRTVCLRFIRSA
jgi:hypothetical protein